MMFAQKLQTRIKNLHPRTKIVLLCITLCVPIILCTLPTLASGDGFPSGDFDMQVQMTEAAKISILEFKQFPYWNPWINGGVPLFADPQFGLFTPQTLFSLFTSSVIAWKLAFVLYLIIGFFSMLKLVNYITRKKLSKSTDWLKINILISYLWIFNSFFWVRFNGGHLTFILLILLPGILYLVLSFDKNKWRPFYITVTITYLFYAALHYPTIFTVLVTIAATAILLLVEVLTKLKSDGWKAYKELLKLKSVRRLIVLICSLVIAAILAIPRLLPTLRYIQQNARERAVDYENFFGIGSALKALFAPFGSYLTPGATYGPFEATSYIGAFTGLALFFAGVFTVWLGIKKRKSPVVTNSYFVAFSLIGVVSFAIGLGGKPFQLIQHLPIFSMMRVSTRYFLVTALCVLLVVSLFSSYIKIRSALLIVSALLAVAVVQVAASNIHWARSSWNPKYLDTTSMKTDSAALQRTTPPEPVRLWYAEPSKAEYALTKSTLYHKTQILTDNALSPTIAFGTARCNSTEKNCKFVLTNNAKVVQWSPNKLLLQRTAHGIIELNATPGSGWRINETSAYAGMPPAAALERFVINDPSKKIVVDYVERGSFDWFISKIFSN